MEHRILLRKGTVGDAFQCKIVEKVKRWVSVGFNPSSKLQAKDFSAAKTLRKKSENVWSI